MIDRPITLPVPGRYNATNAMVAAPVGKLLAISDDDIVEALETIELTRDQVPNGKEQPMVLIFCQMFTMLIQRQCA